MTRPRHGDGDDWTRSSDRYTHRVITAGFLIASVAAAVMLGGRLADDADPSGWATVLVGVLAFWALYQGLSRALRGGPRIDAKLWMHAITYSLLGGMGLGAYVLVILDDGYGGVVVALQLMVLFAAMALVGNERFWTGGSVYSRLEEPHGFYSFSAPLFRAQARAVPVVVFVIVPCAWAVSVDLALTRGLVPSADPASWAWYPTARLVLVAVAVLGAGLVLSIMLLNVPRLLVPPHRRDERGLLG